MKLSVSNIAWHPEQKLEAYALMRDYGVTGLEFAPSLLFPNLASPLHATVGDCNRVLARIAEFDLQPSSMQSLLFGVSDAQLFGSPIARDTLRETTIHAIALAERLGCQNLVFGAPKNRAIPPGMDDVQARAIWHDAFLRIGDAAAAAGVVVALEPNPVQYGTNFMTTIVDTLAIVTSLNHPAIRMNLDLGAAVMTEEIATLETWLPAALNASNHVHLSAPELAPLATQAPAVQRLLSALEAADWQNWVSVEMCGGIPALSESLAACFIQK